MPDAGTSYDNGLQPAGDAERNAAVKSRRKSGQCETLLRVLATLLALAAVGIWFYTSSRPFASLPVGPGRILSNGTSTGPNGGNIRVDVLSQESTCRGLKDAGATELISKWCPAGESVPANVAVSAPAPSSSSAVGIVQRDTSGNTDAVVKRASSMRPATNMKIWYLLAGVTLAMELVSLAYGTLTAWKGWPDLFSLCGGSWARKQSKYSVPRVLIWLAKFVVLFLPIALIAPIWVDLNAVVDWAADASPSVGELLGHTVKPSSELGFKLITAALWVFLCDASNLPLMPARGIVCFNIVAYLAAEFVKHKSAPAPRLEVGQGSGNMGYMPSGANDPSGSADFEMPDLFCFCPF
jgi:hypothetical protein